MPNDLRRFIQTLDRRGELRRVGASVSPLLEVAAIADRESKSAAANPPSESARRNDPDHADLGGRAMLFENVEGSDIPVLINALGSYRRMEMTLGVEGGGFDALAERIAALTEPSPPRSPGELLAKARQLAPLLRAPPRRARRAPCQQIVLRDDDIDLTRLPLIRCWPLDGDLASVGYPPDVNANIPGADLIGDEQHRGRYVTFGGVHTIHADDAGAERPSSHNIGLYRAQLIGRRHLAMHWHMHHDGARHWRSWKKRGEPMPAAIAFGGEAVLPFAAVAPLPPGVSELLFAGFLNGRGIPLTRAATVPLRVPANAEIVIEGWVSHQAGPPGYDPREENAGPLGHGAFFEGPFGDHTGFYSLPDRYPIFEATAITMRREPIFPATIVGFPPQEDYFMGKAVERLFRPLLKTIVHDVVDYDLPIFGAFHNAALVKIRKEYPLQARRVMHALWGAGQMAWTKMIIVVDEDVNVHSFMETLCAMAERCDPSRDVELVRGPLDILDHASPRLGAGSKIGLDATRKMPGDHLEVEAVGESRRTDDVVGAGEALQRVRRLEEIAEARFLVSDHPGWLLFRLESDDPDAGRRAADRIAEALQGSPVRFAIALGRQVNIHNAEEALFHWCANMDPGRDAVRRGSVIVFDASPKRTSQEIAGQPVRDWPPTMRMDASLRDRIESRATELGLSPPPA